jgi:hypothetical protein
MLELNAAPLLSKVELNEALLSKVKNLPPSPTDEDWRLEGSYCQEQICML